MGTIRGKITAFFSLFLLFAIVLTFFFYRNTVDLQDKLVTIENFDDLFNNILELRRYEKNFIYYRDTESFDETIRYFSVIENSYFQLKEKISQVVGGQESEKFHQNMRDYISIFKANMNLLKQGQENVDFTKLREKGKYLVDFAQNLIKVKRGRINAIVRDNLYIPFLSLLIFVVLIAVIFVFINRGILKPLVLVERATEEVSRETFTPIDYPEDRRDEISRLVHAFNRMALELDARQEQLLQSRKMASIGTFTSGIAHELNNPINNISLIVESLIEDDEEMRREERMKLYHDLETQADRTSEIVKNLLEFSRARHPVLEEVSIEELVDKTARLVGNELRIHNIEFIKDVRNQIPKLRVDKSGIQQVLVNMFLNSIQAIEKNGRIKVSLDLVKSGNEIRIDIEDNGTGIPPENLDSIFDPFFTTRDQGGGTGLGLSVSYNIIKKHGGRIEVNSQQGKGTRFSIFLPIERKR